jgi:thioredoxin
MELPGHPVRMECYFHHMTHLQEIMDTATFHDKLTQASLPVVVDFWAPWCGPCRQVKPILEKLAREYTGRVDFWEVNADESQELLHELKVYGIPTLVVYRNGKEIQRQVGAKPAGTLKALFETLASGGDPVPSGLSIGTRLLRLGAGLALVAFGWMNQGNWILLVIGGVIMFTAIYDRCPIWQALTARFKKRIGRA